MKNQGRNIRHEDLLYSNKRVNQMIEDLKVKSNLTEDMKNTDMLYWVGNMNAIKQ